MEDMFCQNKHIIYIFQKLKFYEKKKGKENKNLNSNADKHNSRVETTILIFSISMALAYGSGMSICCVLNFLNYSNFFL